MSGSNLKLPTRTEAEARAQLAKNAQTLNLTAPEMRALIAAIAFLNAGEWSETINTREHSALMRAERKLRAALMKGGAI
jgi:hypothetical protein